MGSTIFLCHYVCHTRTIFLSVHLVMLICLLGLDLGVQTPLESNSSFRESTKVLLSCQKGYLLTPVLLIVENVVDCLTVTLRSRWICIFDFGTRKILCNIFFEER